MPDELRIIEIYTETKCRVCGNLTQWWWVPAGEHDMDTRIRFIDGLNEKANNAEREHCEKCNRVTIQDLVSYEILHDGEKSEYFK